MALKVLGPAVLIFFLLLPPGQAFGFAGFEEYGKSEFSPERKETFALPITLQEKAEIKIGFYTADGDLVRTLASNKPLEKGVHTLRWDGKDDQGNIVPDEAYVPVLEATAASGKKYKIDPRETTGGEAIEDLHVQITSSRDISYLLPAPSRVLIRAGIKGGPMMRSLANWEPRGAGKNIQHWDGMDESRVLDLRVEKGLAVLVTAFRLPDYSIITTGNKTIGYGAYRKGRAWQDRIVDQDKIKLTRGDVRISRQYYVSPAQARDPQVRLNFSGEQKESKEGLPLLKLGQPVQIKVEVDEKDRWLLDQSLYEVAFFIDHEFVSEEEQGYMPLTWVWKVDQVSEGRHVFTVNISGFGGKVGVVSKLFEVVK